MSVKLEIPTGWRLVPTEATPRMIKVANMLAPGTCDCAGHTWEPNSARDAWRAMLAAAPDFDNYVEHKSDSPSEQGKSSENA